MRKVGVARLKASLSEFLSSVKAGDEVLIIERGVPIARIVPVSRAGPSRESVEDLVRAGVIRPPIARLHQSLWKPPRPADPEGAARAALLREREDGR